MGGSSFVPYVDYLARMQPTCIRRGWMLVRFEIAFLMYYVWLDGCILWPFLSNLEEFLDICNIQWFCGHPSTLVYMGCIWFSFCNKVLLILKKGFSWAFGVLTTVTSAKVWLRTWLLEIGCILFIYYTQPCSEHRVNYSIYIYRACLSDKC